jgi:hypothetical protein
MSLQSKTIHRYRQLFPKDSLREVSERTGIQITRVYRLFGGKPMKVKELEAFETAVSLKLAEQPYYTRMHEVLEKAAVILEANDLEKILNHIERKMLNRGYRQLYINTKFEDVSIA